MERSCLSLAAGAGEARGAQPPNRRRLRHRLHPESERPLVFYTQDLAHLTPAPAPARFFTATPPATPPALRPAAWPSSCAAPGLGVPAGAAAHSRPPYAGAPAHRAHPALQRDSRPRARPRRSSSRTHRPPSPRRGPRRGLTGPSPPFRQPSESGVAAPLPRQTGMVPSASSPFPDPFAFSSLRSRVARCRGPAPPPGPGLFTHSPSIPSRRRPPLRRLRAAAPPPRRGPAPRLLRRLRTAPPSRQVSYLGYLLNASLSAPNTCTLESRWHNPSPMVYKAALSGDRFGRNLEETLVSS